MGGKSLSSLVDLPLADVAEGRRAEVARMLAARSAVAADHRRPGYRATR